MVQINRGANTIVGIYRGATAITHVYRGSTLVWQRTADRFDNFDRDNGPLGSNWTDLGPSTDRKIEIEDGRARLKTPDGQLGGVFDSRISMYRWNLQTNSQDDGYVECRPGTKGDAATPSIIIFPGAFFTMVYGRGNNTGGSATNGVGMALAAGHVWIVRRLSSLDQLMVDCGTFQAGDRIRVKSVVNVHTMTINGKQVGVWNDSGATAAKGASYRSLIIYATGGKELLGPRRYSPALDYVLMG